MQFDEADKGGSLRRGALMVEVLAQHVGGCSAVDLAQRTQLPRPTVHRILTQLLELDWVVRDEASGHFTLGPRLAAIGYAATGHHALERAASTVLGAAAHALQQVIYLDVRAGLDAVCIGRYVGGKGQETTQGYVGLRTPFGLTPAAMAMLACMEPGEARRIVNLNLPRCRGIAGFDERGFRRALDRATSSKVQCDAIVLDRKMCGLGVAIRVGCTSDAVGGIGMSYPRLQLSDKDRTRALLVLTQAAEGIADRLVRKARQAPTTPTKKK